MDIAGVPSALSPPLLSSPHLTDASSLHVVHFSATERLPQPFGLVRSGVAPDHPEVKSVTADFTAVAEDPRVNFVGGVWVGKPGETVGAAAAESSTASTAASTAADSDSDSHSDSGRAVVDADALALPSVPLSELRECYDAVVLAYGAGTDRRLSIPGSELSGVLPARAFVNWYNGHPDFAPPNFDPSPFLVGEATADGDNVEGSDTAVIIGQGNVAIDCARVLLKSMEELEKTDIAEHAIDVLRRSRIRRVVIVGRRGHGQASFTMKELRECTKLDGVELSILASDLDDGATEATAEEIKSARATKRMDALLRKEAEARGGSGGGAYGDWSSHPVQGVTDEERLLAIRFLVNPEEYERLPSEVSEGTGSGGATLGGVRVARTRLEGPAGSQKAVETGETVTIPCAIALESIGYRSAPLQGVGFDDRRSVAAGDGLGRVTSSDSGHQRLAPLYVSGWLKRGPSGIVGTNINDARDTVACLRQDFGDGGGDE